MMLQKDRDSVLPPLLASQFLGIFNDHAYRTMAVFTIIGSSGDYSKNAAFLATITIVYALPFIIFPTPAGYLSDKFSKRNMLVITKFVELIIMAMGTLCFANFANWGMIPLLVVMFLMSAQSCFFSPAYNGIIPEFFSEKKISRVNGLSGMLSMLAVLLGVGLGGYVRAITGEKHIYCGIFGMCISTAGFVASLCVEPVLPLKSQKLWTWNWFAEFYKTSRYLLSLKDLFFCALGDGYFSTVGIFFQSVLLIYGKFSLGLEKVEELLLLQLACALGIGFGCFLAGKASGKKIELGFVPYGAIGMFLFMISSLFHGPMINLRGIQIFPMILSSLILAGMSGGFFVVPLRAYIQQKSPIARRGELIASVNVLSFIGIMLGGMILFFLTAGIPESETINLEGIEKLRKFAFIVKPELLISGLAVFTLIAIIIACRKLPLFMFRFAVVTLTNFIYKIRIEGEENIPEEGPALIVANHVSFVDGLLISAASSRIVRFMMHQDYYRHPLFYYFVKWAGFIEVPEGHRTGAVKKMIEQAKNALRQGEVLCIFPEGRLTRNGVMSEFKKGFQMLLPEEIEVPIIPVRLGLIWGSIFSYYYGRIKFRLPQELPYPASVTIGKPVPKNISPFELRQVISEMAADTEMKPRPEERTIHYQFAKFAKWHPFRKIIYEKGKGGISNFVLLYKSVLLSREIKKIDGPERNIVGVLLPNSIATTATILAILNADKIPSVLNFTVSEDTLKKAIEKAEIKTIITSKLFLEKTKIKKLDQMIFLEDIAKNISSLNKIFYAILCTILPHQELMNILAPESHRDINSDAVILFSSGSTGTPKGVILTHRNINADIYSFIRVMGWRPREDRILGNLPLFHSFGFTTSFWLPLMTGTAVIYTSNPLDMVSAGEAIKEFSATIMLSTPTFLQLFIKKCKPEIYKSLRLVIVGAEKMQPSVAEKFHQISGIMPLEGYGCTELSPVVSINIANSILDLGTRSGPIGSVGHPMPGICVKIVDPDTWDALPPNQDGLIIVKGANVMKGYLKEPDLTAKVIKNGWYNTGDIGKMDKEGRIWITGRLSRFSKIAGEMIPHELIETEIHKILNSEERIVAVCGLPDQKKGEKIVVLHLNIPLSPNQIIQEMRRRNLPNLWIPDPENFVTVEQMPVLASGKLDLVQLKKIAEKMFCDHERKQ